MQKTSSFSDIYDENFQIHDISAKLADIRKTLGIDIQEERLLQTPSEAGSRSPRRNDLNTFGKHMANESQNSDKDEPIAQYDTQLYHDKLEELKSSFPLESPVSHPKSKNVSYTHKENAYLKMELEMKIKQNQLLKIQLTKVEEQLTLENQLLRNELQQLKYLHQEFVQSSDLQSDLKQYIISLETDVFMTRQELNVLSQKLSDEEQWREEQKHINEQIEQKVRADLETLYQKHIQELGYVCQALSAELLQPRLTEHNSKLQKLYQDVLDEKFLLEARIEQLESNQFGQTALPSVKVIYENRLNQMKQALLHWKNRSQQVEQIVSQWFKRLRDENNQTKKELIRKQQKMFSMFEDMIKQIFVSFNQDKQALVDHIKTLQKENYGFKQKMRNMEASKTLKKRNA